MSGLGILALLRAAAEALPDGTSAERAAWCKAKEREFAQEAQPSQRRPTAGPVLFEHVSGDPVVHKATEDGDR
jgi:hypothetical protein